MCIPNATDKTVTQIGVTATYVDDFPRGERGSESIDSEVAPCQIVLNARGKANRIRMSPIGIIRLNTERSALNRMPSEKNCNSAVFNTSRNRASKKHTHTLRGSVSCKIPIMSTAVQEKVTHSTPDNINAKSCTDETLTHFTQQRTDRKHAHRPFLTLYCMLVFF